MQENFSSERRWRRIQVWERKKVRNEIKNKALAMKRAIHRQYGNDRHCHGVALFVDAACFNVSAIDLTIIRKGKNMFIYVWTICLIWISSM